MLFKYLWWGLAALGIYTLYEKKEQQPQEQQAETIEQAVKNMPEQKLQNIVQALKKQ